MNGEPDHDELQRIMEAKTQRGKERFQKGVEEGRIVVDAVNDAAGGLSYTESLPSCTDPCP